ncbi:hypothetical protein BpHYR1_008203 [Brachionus plicatilis]|uniref:Uncharacterized protein n=1 Tax=Brachionus plicatilis TaxID=10195 RepID=A0A3M7QQ28_BRAPC|nr:hypothetical protein BpHYR1_008203 [Brachionus plicatilis]
MVSKTGLKKKTGFKNMVRFRTGRPTIDEYVKKLFESMPKRAQVVVFVLDMMQKVIFYLKMSLMNI